MDNYFSSMLLTEVEPLYCTNDQRLEREAKSKRAIEGSLKRSQQIKEGYKRIFEGCGWRISSNEFQSKAKVYDGAKILRELKRKGLVQVCGSVPCGSSRPMNIWEWVGG